MLNKLRNSRRLQCVAVLLASIMLVGFAHVPILREIASFLITEDSLEPAAAIVVLGGQTPFRETEAARLFAQGWAPKLIVVPAALWEEEQALSELGIRVTESWEISREALMREGVPASAIWVVKDDAESNRANR
jgi:uncharacterized SAM-binding protein YcdF (DUF218 family)